MKKKGKSKVPKIPKEFLFCLNKTCENFYRGSRRRIKGEWVWEKPYCTKHFKLPKDGKEADSIALLYGHTAICPKTQYRAKFIRETKTKDVLHKRRLANKIKKKTPEHLKGWGKWLSLVPKMMKAEAKKIEDALRGKEADIEYTWPEAVHQVLNCSIYHNYTVIQNDKRTGEPVRTVITNVCGSSCFGCHARFPPGFSVNGDRFQKEATRYLAKKQRVDIYRDFNQGKISLI